MTTNLEFEAHRVLAPVKNTLALVAQACLPAGPGSQTQEIASLFGRAYNGHFYTLQADGAKCYVAFGSSAGTIDEAAVGTGLSICYPIPDGQERSWLLTGARETATGIATQAMKGMIHFKATASCYLRIYRSSHAPGQDAGEFRVPGLPY